MLWALLLCLVAAGAVASDSSTTWGTYRPQLFVGLRPREPHTVLTGVAWFSTAELAHANHMRHRADQNAGVDWFKWTYHDGRDFGEQVIVDRTHNYRLTTSFVRTGHDAGRAGHWALRVHGAVLDRSRDAQLTTFFYLGSETHDGALEVADAEAHGTALGGFHVRSADAPDNAPVRGVPPTAFAGLRVDPATVWQGDVHIVEVLREQLQARVNTPSDAPRAASLMQLPNRTDAGATLYVLQKTWAGDFTFDVFLDSADAPPAAILTPPALTAALRAHKEALDSQFTHRFTQIASSGAAWASAAVTYARELTSQLLGGIGYYYGESLVDRRLADEDGLVLHDMDHAEPQAEGPNELLTATPSRTAFPRGFYWDEGFHLLHVAAWDPALALEILESWTRLIDPHGWVAREQILGDEARSQVPGPFQTQYPLYANPPTLVFGVMSLLDQWVWQPVDEEVGGAGAASAVPRGHVDALRERLFALYETWQRHYEWYRETQRGQIRQWDRDATSRREAYRWRGRSATHVLTSGLDDYPRASTPHVGELHVDLHSWMGAFARAMQRWAQSMGREDDAQEYADHYADITANLVDLHWNERDELFCDLSVNERDESYFECHEGYVSLFPLMLQLVPADSPQLGAMLRLLRDPAKLWSEHGVRSLSASHPLFGSGEDYWRGAIWLPINYLILSALHAYRQQPGPHAVAAAEAYTALRANVVRTVLQVRTLTHARRTSPRGIHGSSMTPLMAMAGAAIRSPAGPRSWCSS